MVGRAADRGQADYTARPAAETNWTDLDPLEFSRLRRMIEENHGDAALLELGDEQMASALGLTRLEKSGSTPNVAGLLLVGKEAALREHLPSHEVALQVLRGSDVAVNDFRRWPLLRTLEWITEAIQVRNEERELNLGMFRVGVPAYDRRGFREAVNHALIHRDYTRLGAIHVQMHEDHVRVSNPGGFVEGVTPENLLVTEPRPRNPRLADIFKRIGLVERIGRGVGIIYSGQLRNGRQAPSYGLSSATSVSVILPGGPADLDFVQLVVSEENRRQRSFSLSELLILAHLWRERTIGTASAARLIQWSDAEARASLQGLVEAGPVERRGEGQARAYLLSASVYRLLGRPEAYVRARGFEPEQMKQMIVQYAQAHGQISRKDVMELCRVDAPRAYRLLRSLVDEGKLKRRPRGTGRGATYVVGQKRK